MKGLQLPLILIYLTEINLPWNIRMVWRSFSPVVQQVRHPRVSCLRVCQNHQVAWGRNSKPQLCQADGCSRASKDSWYLSFYQPISSPLTVKQHSTS